MSNDWRPGDPKEAAENAPIVQELFSAGVSPDDLEVMPDDDYRITVGDQRVCFGPGSTEGWDYSTYLLEGGDWVLQNQDWAPDHGIVTEICAAINLARGAR